jgi:hypothetical protein
MLTADGGQIVKLMAKSLAPLQHQQWTVQSDSANYLFTLTVESTFCT